MSPDSEAALVDRAVAWVRRNSANPGAASAHIGAETDLIATGLLDSLGIVDLIVHLENQSGGRVDLTDADPAEFGIIRCLCRLALNGRGEQP